MTLVDQIEYFGEKGADSLLVGNTLSTQSFCNTVLSDVFPRALGMDECHLYPAAHQCQARSQGPSLMSSWRAAIAGLIGLPDVSTFRLSFYPCGLAGASWAV